MLLTKTPFRVSFFGGGTDYPAWYLKEEGAVLSTAIDKFCYLTIRYLPPYFPNVKHRVVWSHVEVVSSISEILHPAVRMGLKWLGFDESHGYEIHHQGDLPARTGMATSSAFSAGFIKGLLALKGQEISPHELALKTIEFEQEILKESVGAQDQTAVSHGGFNQIFFKKTGEIVVQPVRIRESRLRELERNLVMVFTGTTRLSSGISSQIIENIHDKATILRKMRAMVDRAWDVLDSNKDLSAFGELLHENWQLKTQLSPEVTNSKIDAIYSRAREAGAIGGKLLGAGSSGFLLFYVPHEKQERVCNALSEFPHVPFNFWNRGCELIDLDKLAQSSPRLSESSLRLRTANDLVL